MNTPYELTNIEEIDALPVQSVVVVQESEFGDHVAWQLTDDVLNHKNSPAEEAPKQAWASTYYKSEHDSADLLSMSYDQENPKVLVVYEHPAR